MLVELVAAVWIVGVVVYLLQPLVVDSPGALWDSSWWLSEDDDTAESTPTRRAIADVGRVCQNCGTRLDEEFTFCGECLTPVV